MSEFVMMKAARGAAEATLYWAGEGVSCDYDAEDPDDIRLLRFDAKVTDVLGNSFEDGWCSGYLTTDTHPSLLWQFLHLVLEAALSTTPRRRLQELTHVTPAELQHACVHDRRFRTGLKSIAYTLSNLRDYLTQGSLDDAFGYLQEVVKAKAEAEALLELDTGSCGEGGSGVRQVVFLYARNLGDLETVRDEVFSAMEDYKDSGNAPAGFYVEDGPIETGAEVDMGEADE